MFASSAIASTSVAITIIELKGEFWAMGALSLFGSAANSGISDGQEGEGGVGRGVSFHRLLSGLSQGSVGELREREREILACPLLSLPLMVGGELCRHRPRWIWWPESEAPCTLGEYVCVASGTRKTEIEIGEGSEEEREREELGLCMSLRLVLLL